METTRKPRRRARGDFGGKSSGSRGAWSRLPLPTVSASSTSASGMSRRHFMQHLAASTMTIPGLAFLNHLSANATEVRKNQKACILLWMSGGPPTIDIWGLNWLHDLLIEELNHRVKNTLALMQAIAVQTFDTQRSGIGQSASTWHSRPACHLKRSRSPVSRFARSC